MNNLIALVGLSGVGKTTIANYFTKQQFQKVYLGSLILKYLLQHGFEVNEKNESNARIQIRKQYGKSALIQLSLQDIMNALTNGDVIIDNLNTIEEWTMLNNYFSNVKLIGVLCNKDLRIERLNKRKDRALEISEIISRDKDEAQNFRKGELLFLVDYFITNNSCFDSLYTQINETIAKIRGDDIDEKNMY